jgi:hypothetical protein
MTLGSIGGFAAGLLGFGGGVVMFPLLFYIPFLLGLAALDAKTVAALVVAQVFFSSLIGGAAHLKSGRVHRSLAVWAGASSAIGAFAGGVGSKWTAEIFLLLLFGAVSLLVAAMMLLPPPPAEREILPTSEISFPRATLAVVSFFVGLVIGLLGAGNFVFVPLLIYGWKIPTRIAIGSSLLIAVINTSSGFLAKLLTDQIPFFMAFAVVAGATLGAVLGERSHGRVSPQMLRHAYAVTVLSITVTIWSTLLTTLLRG